MPIFWRISDIFLPFAVIGSPSRRTLPSFIIQDPDMTAAEEVLANSNKAEEFIINTLNGSRKY